MVHKQQPLATMTAAIEFENPVDLLSSIILVDIFVFLFVFYNISLRLFYFYPV